MTFKPVQFSRSPKSTKNGTLKIASTHFVSNRSSFEDPQNQPKTGPQNCSPHPEMTFKPIQFSKGPKPVIFKFLPRGICVTPVRVPAVKIYYKTTTGESKKVSIRYIWPSQIPSNAHKPSIETEKVAFCWKKKFNSQKTYIFFRDENFFLENFGEICENLKIP